MILADGGSKLAEPNKIAGYPAILSPLFCVFIYY